MELLILAIVAIGVLLLVSYPVNGHGSGYYPYFGPDGDRGPERSGYEGTRLPSVKGQKR